MVKVTRYIKLKKDYWTGSFTCKADTRYMIVSELKFWFFCMKDGKVFTINKESAAGLYEIETETVQPNSDESSF